MVNSLFSHPFTLLFNTRLLRASKFVNAKGIALVFLAACGVVHVSLLPGLSVWEDLVTLWQRWDVN